MQQIITCINCPVGCRMTVTLSDSMEFLSVTGNTCPRGARYAKQECTLPKRTITAVLRVSGSNVPLSVKTSSPIPKDQIREVMAEIARVHLSVPISAGSVIIPNVLNTGADIIATRGLPD